MKFKVATPISTLFQKVSSAQIEQILSLSDALEERDRGIDCESDLPRIFHCELSVVEKWTEEEINHVAELVRSQKILLVSFHVHSCFVKPNIENSLFVPTGTRMIDEEMVKNAQTNIAKLRKKIGDTVEIAIENNNYFKTGAYESVAEPSFLTTLCAQIPCMLLLDIGHAEISAKHLGTTLDEYVAALPLHKVRQIHLSGIERGEKEYGDAHEALSEVDWLNFERIQAKCPSLEFVTIEYYKDVSRLIEMLKKLRSYT
ncbi:MAG: DUF692 family protein [bacterium]|nr:DUF692 family protein [bacterium]